VDQFVTATLDDLHHEWGAQEPSDLGRFFTGRPGFVSRHRQRQQAIHLLLRGFIAQSGIESSFGSGVTEQRIKTAACEDNQLIRVDSGSVEVEPPAAPSCCQITQMLSIRRIVDFKTDVLKSRRQGRAPFLRKQRRQAKQSDRGWRYPGLQQMFEQRYQQFGKTGQVLVEHDDHVVIGRQGLSKSRKAMWVFQGFANGGNRVGKGCNRRLPMDGHQLALPNLNVEMLLTIVDADPHARHPVFELLSHSFPEHYRTWAQSESGH
jgi:hypothetical protein